MQRDELATGAGSRAAQGIVQLGRERALERQSSLSNGRISAQIMYKYHLEMYS